MKTFVTSFLLIIVVSMPIFSQDCTVVPCATGSYTINGSKVPGGDPGSITIGKSYNSGPYPIGGDVTISTGHTNAYAAGSIYLNAPFNVSGGIYLNGATYVNGYDLKVSGNISAVNLTASGKINAADFITASGNNLMSQSGFFGFRRTSDGAAIPMITVTPNGTLSNLQIGSGSGQFNGGYTDIFAGGASRLRILPNGNVQIGNLTSSQTSTPISIDLGGTYSNVSGNNLKLKIYDDGTSIGGFGISASQIDYKTWSNAADHVFYQGTTELMRIKGIGNVLIGKTTQTNATYKLDVSGYIRADQVVVNSTGADFVFENNYKLRSLKEVETYVNENKHLPDIATAKDMQENGVSVSEMQTKLLQKVEEITIYMIELKKENEELKSEIEKLKNK
jgi:hypothetical protein